MARILYRAQSLCFAAALTLISRFLLIRDLLCGRVRSSARNSTAFSRTSTLVLSSGVNRLDAILVEPALCPARAVVLLCHGIGEVVEHWSGVQQLLAEEGVASMVFDYSGYGRSSGNISAARCEEDAVAAHRYLEVCFPHSPISVLGFSLGSAICAAVLPRVSVHRLVLCAAFTSFRAAARSVGVARSLTFIVPDIWSSQHALRSCSVPALILHGDCDQLFPVQMARDLQSSFASRADLVILRGLSHNDPYTRPERSYWRLVVEHLVSR